MIYSVYIYEYTYTVYIIHIKKKNMYNEYNIIHILYHDV